MFRVSSTLTKRALSSCESIVAFFPNEKVNVQNEDDRVRVRVRPIREGKSSFTCETIRVCRLSGRLNSLGHRLQLLEECTAFQLALFAHLVVFSGQIRSHRRWKTRAGKSSIQGQLPCLLRLNSSFRHRIRTFAISTCRSFPRFIPSLGVKVVLQQRDGRRGTPLRRQPGRVGSARLGRLWGGRSCRSTRHGVCLDLKSVVRH